jgi:hypothetical protein
VPGWLWAATASAYFLPIVYVATLFLGSGHTPYDRLSRTTVIKYPAEPATGRPIPTTADDGVAEVRSRR